MHKVGKWQLCPGRKQKRQHRRGYAYSVKEVSKRLGWLEYVYCYEKNIDRTKLKRQIVLGVAPECDKHHHLQDLVKHDKTRNGKSPTLSSYLSALAVKKATDGADGN